MPPGALVRFDGAATQQVGLTRHFVTPPLNPAREYTYDISVSWMDGGRAMVRRRHLTVWAGEHLTINFGRPILGTSGPDLLRDPAAPNPSGTSHYENPLNWSGSPSFGDAGPARPVDLPAQAAIRILVPADAEVLFDGAPTTQKGTERLFLTPPLEAGKNYRYDVLAHWKKDGKTVEVKCRVGVTAGARGARRFLDRASEREGQQGETERGLGVPAGYGSLHQRLSAGAAKQVK